MSCSVITLIYYYGFGEGWKRDDRSGDVHVLRLADSRRVQRAALDGPAHQPHNTALLLANLHHLECQIAVRNVDELIHLDGCGKILVGTRDLVAVALNLRVIMGRRRLQCSRW